VIQPHRYTVFLTGTRPMVRPNAPNPSRHTLIIEPNQRLRFVTRRAVEKLWRPLAGLSWPHPRWARYDLVHSFNAIPLTTKPWITTFESVLPRTIGPGGARLGRMLRDRMTQPNCRALIAMSQYASRRFAKANRDWPALDAALRKVTVVYPHFPARPAPTRQYSPDSPLRVIFVGNHFAQKGGIAALRAITRATALGLPVRLDIFSALKVGPGVYADHPDERRYAADLRALDHPAVTFHGRRPNADVLAAMSNAHVQLLPTLDDTFGYSVVEGLSTGLPAIVSDICAMPELVPADTGARLALPSDEWNQWTGLARRGDTDYWDLLTDTYDALATQLVAQLTAIIEEPGRIERWSVGASARFQALYESRVVSERLDALYDAALNGM
jgi:glycosyltransferase involved in cell wall biosynthesis